MSRASLAFSGGGLAVGVRVAQADLRPFVIGFIHDAHVVLRFGIVQLLFLPPNGFVQHLKLLAREQDVVERLAHVRYHVNLEAGGVQLGLLADVAGRAGGP